MRWNSLGVSFPLHGSRADLARWAVSQVDYLSVRDTASRAILEELSTWQQFHVVPDSIIEVSGLWTSDEITAAYEQIFDRGPGRRPTRASLEKRDLRIPGG